MGVIVAIIGVTSIKPYDRGYDFTETAQFIDPVRRESELAEEARPKSDIQIALSHVGFIYEIRMRGVSAVIGGDSHIRLNRPHVVTDGANRIPVVQAGGELDNHLGRLDLTYVYIGGGWLLLDFSGFLYSLAGVEPCQEIQAILDKYDAMLRAGTQNAA